MARRVKAAIVLVLLAIATPAAAFAQTSCYIAEFSGPVVPDFRAVLSDCRRVGCESRPHRPIVSDAGFDELFFGTEPVKASKMRQLSQRSVFAAYLSGARDAIRSHAFRRAFGIYYAEFTSPTSLTRQIDFVDGSPDLADLLRRASTEPFTADMEGVLNRLCAAHSESKQLRLYAALGRLERHDTAGALRLMVTAPYLRPSTATLHYESIDSAALDQALVVDEGRAVRALASVRASMRRQAHLR
jgi:hypothetical protein